MTLLGEKMWSISQIDKENYKGVPYLCHLYLPMKSLFQVMI